MVIQPDIAGGWLPALTYDTQTEAILQVAADPTVVHWTHPSGEKYTIDYVIPNTNQCKECHEKSKATVPIGPKARNLNRDFQYADGRANQLAYWTRIGYLKGAPPTEQAPRAVVWDDPASGTLEARALVGGSSPARVRASRDWRGRIRW